MTVLIQFLVDSLRASFASVHISISWLWGFFVLDHLILKTNQDFLHGVVRIPVFKHMELTWLNNTVILIHAWDVDL
jgi:hypothetical protein